MPMKTRTLMGPGPSNIYPEVALGLASPMLGHLDPRFLALLDETNDRLRTVWRTSNQLTFPVSGTGSAGMEMSFVNVVAPESVVVVGVNGVFGQRMCEVAARAGGDVVRVDFEWGTPVDPETLVAAHPSPDVIALVHAETSTGVRSDVAAVGAMKGDALLIADCVTSLGGIPVEIDEWGVDIAYSGSQKCLGVPPGLSPFSINERAMDRLLPTPRSWYLDLNLIAGYVGSGSGRSYHHTAPITMIQALHAGLGALLDEGLENSWARHQAVGDMLKQGLVDRGFSLFAEEGHRLPQLTTAMLPSGVNDEAAVRRRLLNEFDIEVGGGLGPVAGKVWRIGTMGHTARASNVITLLGALDAIMGEGA